MTNNECLNTMTRKLFKIWISAKTETTRRKMKASELENNNQSKIYSQKLLDLYLWSSTEDWDRKKPNNFYFDKKMTEHTPYHVSGQCVPMRKYGKNVIFFLLNNLHLDHGEIWDQILREKRNFFLNLSNLSCVLKQK